MAVTEQVMILLKAKDDASKVIDEVSKSASGLSKAASVAVKAAGAATVLAVGGITAAIGAGVKKAADLEQGVADIASVMGITAKDAKPLKDLIANLGMDPKLKVNADEASDAIMQLAQSGMSMQDILDGAARSTVLLSNATGGDMATSAAIASDAMSLFGISADEMSRAVNGITGVTVASKFGIQDYQLALSQAGGVASAVGVGFEDFNTTIAAISPYFASGSDAGTSFKTFLQRLIPSSNEAESAMRALGLITADGANQFFNADGSMRSMSEIAGLLQGSMAGLTEEQRNAALSTIFGTDAMRAAVGLAETGSGKFDEMAASIGRIDAEASAATRMDTLSGSMEIFQGIVDGLLTKIGDTFLPIARKFTDWAIELATTHGPALVGWFANLAAAIPPILNQVQEWSGKVTGAVSEIMRWLGGQYTNFNNLQAVWNQVTTIFSNVVGAVIQYVKDNTPKWIEQLLSWAQSARSWAESLWVTYISPGLASAWASISSWVTDPAKRQIIFDALMGWWNQFASWANNLWAGTLQPGLASMWDSMSAWLDTNADGLGTKLENWTGAFFGVGNDIIADWEEAWPKIEQIVAGAREQIGEDVDRIIESLNKITGWFSGGEGENAMISWSGFFTLLAQTVAGTVTNITGTIASLVEVVSKLGELFQAMQAMDWGTAGTLAAEIAQQYASLLTMPFTLPAQSAWDAWQAMQGRASGGPVTAGSPYLVGERGPELFVPGASGRIVPNNQISNSTTNNYTVNLAGSGDAQRDVMASLRLVGALYG